MERHDIDVEPTERGGGIPDLGLAWQEDENVPWQVRRRGHRTAHAVREAASVRCRCPLGKTPSFHRKDPPLRVDVPSADVLGNAVGRQGRTHDDEPRAGVEQQRQQQVEVQTALVEFVEHDAFEAGQIPRPQHAQCHAGRDEDHPCIGVGAALVPHDPADVRAGFTPSSSATRVARARHATRRGSTTSTGPGRPATAAPRSTFLPPSEQRRRPGPHRRRARMRRERLRPGAWERQSCRPAIGQGAIPDTGTPCVRVGPAEEMAWRRTSAVASAS